TRSKEALSLFNGTNFEPHVGSTFITQPPVASCSLLGKVAAIRLRPLSTGAVIEPCPSHRLSPSESTTCPDARRLLKSERWPSYKCLSLVGGVGIINRPDSERNWSGVSGTGISGSGFTTRKDCTSSCCSLDIAKGSKRCKECYYQTSSTGKGKRLCIGNTILTYLI